MGTVLAAMITSSTALPLSNRSSADRHSTPLSTRFRSSKSKLTACLRSTESSGGVMIAVTKSGTNSFHGSVYEYLRNEALDARNFFEDPSQRKNPFKYNEFGGTIG